MAQITPSTFRRRVKKKRGYNFTVCAGFGIAVCGLFLLINSVLFLLQESGRPDAPIVLKRELASKKVWNQVRQRRQQLIDEARQERDKEESAEENQRESSGERSEDGDQAEAEQESEEAPHSILGLMKLRSKKSLTQQLRESNVASRNSLSKHKAPSTRNEVAVHRAEEALNNDAVVTLTADDPDGLKQKMKQLWNTTECFFGEAHLPPKIESSSKIIPPPSDSAPHMGILLDAARHYFPLEWLYGLIDFLEVLGYKWIHFRLTDDQSFVVKLDSRPELVLSSHPDRPQEYYTSQELKDVVQYAKEHGISIIPEVNVPGHAGGWQGIPGLVYPCVKFICSNGYAIPLNVENPEVLQVIEDVLREIIAIFSTAPYLHLGGDELSMSEPCFAEIQHKPDFQAFENSLKTMLESKLNYPLEKVARWETSEDGTIAKIGTGFQALDRVVKERAGFEPLTRAGEMMHWWRKLPPEGADKPFVISSDLYFDASMDRDAWDIFNITTARYGMGPLGVIAATFELGPCTWNVRNVWGKLVAVAMGAAWRGQNLPERDSFMVDYRETCHRLGLSNEICSLEGRPTIPTEQWIKSHHLLHDGWVTTACDRLTFPEVSRGMRIKDTVSTRIDFDSYAHLAIERAQKFKGSIRIQETVSAKSALYVHKSKHTGVMVDLAHHYFSSDMLHQIIDVASKLGFNLLHLRLVENEFYPLRLPEYENLARPVEGSKNIYSEDELKSLVNYAAQQGVSIMPEINFLSDGGGWYKSALLVECPNYICDTGAPIPVDINKGRALAMLSIVCGTLMTIFHTAPYIHMGSMDYEVVEPCYREAYPLGNFNLTEKFNNFEAAMATILTTMGMSKDRIVKWESSSEQVSSLGGVTHFRQTTPVEGTVKGSFLLSADTSLEAIGDDNAWDIYQHTHMSYNADAAGVIVGTNGLESADWESQNVFGRLIAIAAGLSNIDTMSEEAFRSHYESKCQDLGLSTSTCSSFGKPVSSAAEWDEKRSSYESSLKEYKCKTFTQKGATRRARDSATAGH